MKQHPGEPYFAAVADRLGKGYLRYSFTKGTQQEVSFLVDVLKLPAGARVLDVGCGPGRHSIELAKRGYAVTGVDISRKFLDLAVAAANEAGVKPAFFEVDARQMPFGDEFDAVISLCQGGFGLMGADDGLVMHRMAEALKPGGRLLMTAFSGYFEASHPRDATFDIDTGLVHELAPIADEAGNESRMDLWTSVFTPRELRLLAIGVGLIPEHIWSVSPGDYARRPPSLEHPEFLLVAHKPH